MTHPLFPKRDGPGARSARQAPSLGSNAWNPTTARRRKARTWRGSLPTIVCGGIRPRASRPASRPTPSGTTTEETGADGGGTTSLPAQVAGWARRPSGRIWAIAVVAAIVGAVAASGVGMVTGVFEQQTVVMHSVTPSAPTVTLASATSNGVDWSGVDDAVAPSVVGDPGHHGQRPGDRLRSALRAGRRGRQLRDHGQLAGGGCLQPHGEPRRRPAISGQGRRLGSHERPGRDRGGGSDAVPGLPVARLGRRACAWPIRCWRSGRVPMRRPRCSPARSRPRIAR